MFKKHGGRITAIAAAVFMALSGCAAQDAAGHTAKTAPAEAEQAPAGEGIETADAEGSGAYDISELFTDRDLSGSYDESGATTVALNGVSVEADGGGVDVSGTTVMVTEKGVYVLSGTLDGGQIVVDAGDEKVQLVLAGVRITNDDGACIYVRSADKVFITLAAGTENVLADGGKTYVQTDDATVDGVIFSRDTLTVNGEGALAVQAGYKHGIVSKDDLKVTGGKLTITAAGKGLQGKDSVRIGGGTIAIDAGTEGIEGEEVWITAGDVAIRAKDDGINAAGRDDKEDDGGFSHGRMGDADEDCMIRITGGNLYVNAGGDGIDSNGYIYVDGGAVFVDGPTSDGDGALDYGIDARITGGKVVAAGSGGMAENFGQDSAQYSILVCFDTAIGGGTAVMLADADGNEVLSATPTKDYRAVVFSAPAIGQGSYTASAGDQTVEIEVSEISTRVGSSGFGFGGRGGFGNRK